MADKTEVKANLDELNKLTRFLKESYSLKVGILGKDAKTDHGDVTNGFIGAVHEFGSEKRNIPQRSFLWKPLVERMNFNNDSMKEIKKTIFKQFFIKKSPYEFFRMLKSKALDIIAGAFATNGYGEWKALSDPYLNREVNKKYKSWRKRLEYRLSRNILVKTGQLENSITGKIEKNDK